MGERGPPHPALSVGVPCCASGAQWPRVDPGLRLSPRMAGRTGVAAGAADGSRRRLILAVLCLCAFAVRLGVHAAFPSIAHPDETYQYVEPAHRLVFGTGLVTWEYVVGVRSWLIPGVLAGVLEVSRLFGGGPAAQQWAIAVFMAALSLPLVICGFVWGLRAGGLAAAIIAGALNALWFEPVFFSVHPLADTIGAVCLVCGVFVAYPGAPVRRRWRWFAAGVLYGLVLGVRVQLAPAIAVVVPAVCRGDLRDRWRPLAAGAALALLALGGLDALTWHAPFQSIWLYLWLNAGWNISSYFGVAPWYAYLLLEFGYCSFLLPVIVGFVVLGGRRLPVLLAVAVVLLVSLSLVPHKEDRFLYPVLPFVLTLAGIGAAATARRIAAALHAAWGELRLGTVCAALCAALSLLLGAYGGFAGHFREGATVIAAIRQVSADPAACGLAVDPADEWWRVQGYAGLRRGIPLYGIDPGTPAASSAAFNYAVSGSREDLSAYGLDREACHPDWRAEGGRQAVCLWHRAGGCIAGAAPALRAVMPGSFWARLP